MVELLSWLSSIRLSVCYVCTVAKWCKIGPRLLLITDRNHIQAFQTTYKSLTLDDLESRYALLWLNCARLGSRLLLMIDNKSHIGFQLTSTLYDLEGH